MRTPTSPGGQPTLAGLPQFIRYLNTFPPSQQVLEALFRGPLAHLQARVGQLYRVADDELVSLAYVGPPQSVGERHYVLPLSVDMPMTRAVHAREVHAVPIRSFLDETVLKLDRDAWDPLVAETGVATVVNVPLVHAGDLVGALGFAMARPWDGSGLDPQVVRGVAGALALWITHPSTGLVTAPQSAREWSLSLTGRQREALGRVRAGASTAAIAEELDVSESTVKQDLLRAMKAMRTNDRLVAAQRAESLGLL